MTEDSTHDKNTTRVTEIHVSTLSAWMETHLSSMVCLSHTVYIPCLYAPVALLDFKALKNCCFLCPSLHS